jgi:hypothetical protein
MPCNAQDSKRDETDLLGHSIRHLHLLLHGLLAGSSPRVLSKATSEHLLLHELGLRQHLRLKVLQLCALHVKYME